MLHHLVELTSIVLRPEPLNQKIERHYKQMWEEAPCPDFGETNIKAGDKSPRLSYTTADIRSPTPTTQPFKCRTLTPGEILIDFILYADTLGGLASTEVAQLFETVYDPVHTTIREMGTALSDH